MARSKATSWSASGAATSVTSRYWSPPCAQLDWHSFRPAAERTVRSISRKLTGACHFASSEAPRRWPSWCIGTTALLEKWNIDVVEEHPPPPPVNTNNGQEHTSTTLLWRGADHGGRTVGWKARHPRRTLGTQIRFETTRQKVA